MYKKLLIANRGEIALRIIKTARKLGIKTVAIYSEADTNALFVQEADEQVFIGPSPSSQSYLVIPNIIDAIHATGADAVHPGYGFLSENAEFCKAVEKAGAAFVGPSVKAIKAMGDKLEAKKLAIKAGVSVVPGSEGAVSTVKEAKPVADRIGYPVLIKAAAGGGGKGMRIVKTAQELEDGIRGAVHEAGASFGDARVFIEKYIEQPRHIEIQILADKHGNIVSLGERECSIQRRHQKIIEEAPSPFLNAETREAMSSQAIALAKAVSYSSAGTVEFIVDKHQNFYFLEMNTRLQVEHRVTELVTGIDLVEMMLRIAEGEKLPFTQEDIKTTGWAIESRIYAEDPRRGFLPSVGRITRYEEPTPLPGMVLDTGVYEGAEVSMFYDPMIAKLCTYGETRERAIEDMRAALGEFVIRGIAHNMSFLEAVMNNPRYVEGDTTTNFIAEEYPEGFSGAELTTESSKVFMAAGLFIHLRYRERDASVSGQRRLHPLTFIDRWVVSVDQDLYPVTVEQRDTGYDITFGQDIITIRSNWKLGRPLFQGTVNGKPVNIKVRKLDEGFRLFYAGSSVDVIVRTPRVSEYAKHIKVSASTILEPELSAPIAGLVVQIRVKEGDKVKAGTELMLVEAMKMENGIHSEHPAVVKKIHVKTGDSVTVGQALMELEFEVAAA